MIQMTRPFLAAALVASVAAAPALASGHGPAPHAVSPHVLPVQAEAPAGWTRYDVLGVSLALPAGYQIVNEEPELVIFASLDTQSYGEVEVIVTTMEQAYGEIMGELDNLPDHLMLDRSTRNVPGLGEFEEVFIDGRDDPEDPAMIRVLSAPDPGPGVGRLMVLLAGFEPMMGGADWVEIRSLLDGVADSLMASGT